MQVTETTSSVAMDKEAFHWCIEAVKGVGFKIAMVATDRHTDIAALCRTAYPEIDHQFDIWHVCKSLMKTLTKAGLMKTLTKAGLQRECE